MSSVNTNCLPLNFNWYPVTNVGLEMSSFNSTTVKSAKNFSKSLEIDNLIHSVSSKVVLSACGSTLHL